MRRILIVEPDRDRQASLRLRIQDEGYEALVVDSVELALPSLRSTRPDLALLAEDLGAMIDGYELAERLVNAEGDRCPILLYSQLPSTAERIERALRVGCDGFLGSVEIGALGAIVARALARKAKTDRLEQRQQALELENREARTAPPGQQRARAAGTDRATDRAAAERLVQVGLLVVDVSGIVRHADRGVRELLGARVEGRSLGSLLPSSGLEGFVRDTRTERREGFRFDFMGPQQRRSRPFVASVSPLAPVGEGDEGSGLRVVSIYDAIAGDDSVGAAAAVRHELASLVELARESHRPASWIGQSAVARGLRSSLSDLIARGASPVLIHGPRGSGKELLARILHYSGRSAGPFLRLRCSAFSPENLERELFGDPRDRTGERAGLCQMAGGGTLFLEEIGDLPRATQLKLLEVIENGVLPEPRGPAQGAQPVRWVAATTGDLRRLVERDLFHEPLYTKLRSSELSATPLGTRPDDLLELILHYLARFGSAKGVFAVAPEALRALQQYEWPGNVDELADCMEQACFKARGKQIELEDLTRPLRGVGDTHGSTPSLLRHWPAGGAVLGRPMGSALPAAEAWEPRPWEITDHDPINLDHYQKKALLRALARCGGDKVAAARLLNVGKSTFYRKLKRYGITEGPGAPPR